MKSSVHRSSLLRLHGYALLSVAAQFVLPLQSLMAGDVFTNTGADLCSNATVVPVSAGPVGNPTVVTILGNNSSATSGENCGGAPIVGAT
jgi:hypothetical protein